MNIATGFIFFQRAIKIRIIPEPASKCPFQRNERWGEVNSFLEPIMIYLDMRLRDSCHRNA